MQLGMVLIVLEVWIPHVPHEASTRFRFQVPPSPLDNMYGVLPSHHSQLHLSPCHRNGVEVQSLVTLIRRSAGEAGFKEEPDLSIKQAVSAGQRVESLKSGRRGVQVRVRTLISTVAVD